MCEMEMHHIHYLPVRKQCTAFPSSVSFCSAFGKCAFAQALPPHLPLENCSAVGIVAWFFLSLQLLLLKVCLLSGVQDRPNSKSRPSYVSRERLYGITVDAHMNCRCSTNALICLDSQRHLLVGTIMGVLSWQEVTRQMPQSCTFCKCCLVHSVDGHNMDVKSITAGWYWWQVCFCNFWIRVHSSVAIVRSGSVLWYLVFTDLISTLLYPPQIIVEQVYVLHPSTYLPQGGNSLCLHTYWVTRQNGHLNWSVSEDLCAHGGFRPWQLDYNLFWLSQIHSCPRMQHPNPEPTISDGLQLPLNGWYRPSRWSIEDSFRV